MIKDVKRKIIISVASVLLLAAAIGVVPLVQAASGTSESKFTTGRANVNDVTYSVTIENNELAYNGQKRDLKVSSIEITSDAELNTNLQGKYINYDSACVKEYFVSETDKTPVDPINAGEYYCEIHMPKTDGFNVDTVGFNFKINKTSAEIVDVDVSDPYYGTGAKGYYLTLANKEGKSTPQITAVDLEIRDETGTKVIKLNPSQFEVTPIDAVGEKTVEVTVIDTDNFDISDPTYSLSYISAYDLSNLPDDKYKIDFTGESSAEYTGRDIPVALELQRNDGTKLDSSNFITTPSNVKNVGDYDITIKPISSSKPYAQTDGVYFAGSCTKKFRVTGKSLDKLVLGGVGPEGDVLITPDTVKMDYTPGKIVDLTETYSLYLKDDTGKYIDFTYEYEGNDSVGYASIIVKPVASSGYTGTKRFEFLILGDLVLYDFRFTDAARKSTELFYRGTNRYIDGTPVVHSGDEASPLTTAQYELYYQYEDESGNWLPDINDGHGYSQSEMVGATKGSDCWNKMSSTGNKKINIIGKGSVYAGKTGELGYSINTVEISNTKNEYGEFRVALKDKSTPIVYNGTEQEPEVIVQYLPKDSVSKEWVTLDGEKDYNVTYFNNINAGTANIKVTGTGAFSGEYNTTFEIKPLSGSLVVLDGNEPPMELSGNKYEYNGSPIKPRLGVKIATGQITEINYVFDDLVYLKSSAGEALSDFATNVGLYKFMINVSDPNIDARGWSESTYTIAAKDLTISDFSIDPVEWNGGKIIPEVKANNGLVKDRDYELGIVKDNGAKGTGKYVITGKGNFKNTVEVPFTILPRSMSGDYITASGSVSYVDGKYNVTLTVRDEEAETKSLTLGKDYTVTIHNKKTNEVVSQGDDSSKIVLATAGSYVIDITGKDNYTGNATKSVDIECGINLEDYYLYIPVPGDRLQPYAFGEEVSLSTSKIKILDSYGVDQSSKFQTTGNLDKLEIRYYNLTKYPKGDTTGYTDLVGQIFISAIPNGTDNTIYGETKKVYDEDGELRLGTYYNVVAAKWNQSAGFLNVEVNGGKDLVYAPMPLRDDIPDIKVTYDPDGSEDSTKSPIELQLGVDYEITYNVGDIWTTDKTKVIPAYLNSGSHYYHIIGIGNYADSSNDSRRYYNIEKATIVNEWVDKNDKVDYLSTERAFKIVYKTLKSDGTYEDQGIDLEAGVDYTLTGPTNDFTDEDHPLRKYTVSTKSGSNYKVDNGSIDIAIEITQSNLAETAPFENGFDEAKEGEIYVVWEKSSLDIKDHYKPEGDRDPVEPKFSLIYLMKKGDTPEKSNTKELKLGEDYDLAIPNEYGPNRTVGENAAANFVRIKGMGGFMDTEVSIPCTLYYPLLHSTTDENNKIIFTETKGNIYPGATFVNEEFKSLSPEELAEKVVMNYHDGSRSEDAADGAGGLNMGPDDYKVEVLTKETGIGIKKIRVTGTETAPHYFKGSFTFEITTTGDLSNAKVQVGNKTNNEVEFDTRYLSKDSNGLPDGLPIKVTLGGKVLKVNDDYEITSVNHPDGLGIGHVHIKGKKDSDYDGTAVDVDYSVVATLNSNKYLKFEIKGNDGTFHNDNGINTELKKYPYQNGTDEEPGVRPEVQLSLITLDSEGKEASQIESYTGKYLTTGDSTADKDYLVSYSNNNGATKNAGIILKASGVEQSYLRGTKTITFEIKQTSLDPNKNKQIDVTWDKEPKYNGRPFDAKSLNLIVKDLNCTGEKQTLVSGVDYTLDFEGRDNTNVTKQKVLGYIVAKDKGNYMDRYPIEIEIKPWSFTDDEMTNDDVEMTYTGSPIAEDEIGPNIVLNQGGEYTRKLAYPKDFKIIGFVNSAGTTLTEKPKEVGEYKLTLEGVGNYAGRMNINYEITPLDLTNATITFKNSERCPLNTDQMPDCTYDGHVHEPAILVKYQNRDLTQGIDYDVEYEDNINAGIAKVHIKVVGSGTQNYIGTQEKKFQIQPKNITDKTISFSEILEEYPFTMKTVHPGDTMTITDTSIEASIGLFYELRTNAITTPGVIPDNTDYIVTYVSDNAAKEVADKVPTCSYAGHVQMTVSGCGNYTGTKKYDYYIGTCIDVAEPVIINTKTEYNGLYQPPVIEEVKKNKLVLADDEFTVAAYKGTISKDNLIDITKIVDAGTYKITVAGVPEKGTYTKNPKSQTVYTVEPRSITSSEVSGFDGMYYYTGKAICPKGIVVTDIGLPVSDADYSAKKNVQLRNKVDYEVAEYKNNINAGKATIVIKGIGNYKGNVYGYFTIDSSNVSGGESYDESSVGTGTIASKDGSISIAATDITLTYDPSDGQFMRYTGYSVRPGVMFKDYKYNISDFYVTVQNSVDPGIATMIISGDGNNFTGSIKLNYTIKADLSKYGKIAPIPDQVYTGNAITPPVTIQVGGVILRDGTDYSLSYVNNTNVGKATVKATATNNKKCFYYGSIQGDFNISNAAGGMQVSGYATSYAYTGSPIAPEVVVSMNNVPLTKGTDYTVTYKNNTNVGVASITVTGIGKYSGSKTVTFTIGAKNIENCITSQIGNQEYTGRTYTPVISVSDAGTGKTLISGSDYILTYSNNTNPGTATVTIQAIGKNYTGTKTVNFKITSAAVTGLKVQKTTNHTATLSWSKQSYADGYQICNKSNRVIGTTTKNSYTVNNLASAKTYSYKVRSYVKNADGSLSYGDFSSIASGKTLLNTPKLRVDATGNGVVTLRWTKIKKATGYEIYYSTSKNGTYYKLASISKNANRIFNDKGLARGEVYYYTIRAYRNVSGKKVYSNYNTIQKATVR